MNRYHVGYTIPTFATGEQESVVLRAIPKVGTRRKQWLIVNEHGGLVKEFTGTKREAEKEARRIRLGR